MPTVHSYRQNLYSFRIQYLNGALVMLRTDPLLVAKEGDLFMQVRRARLLDKAEVFVILIYEVNKKTIVIFRKHAVCLRLSLVVSSAFIVLCSVLQPKKGRDSLIAAVLAYFCRGLPKKDSTIGWYQRQTTHCRDMLQMRL